MGPGGAIAMLVVLSSTACTPDPAGLDWRYRFEPPDLRDVTAWIEARILRGGCTSEQLHYRTEFETGSYVGDAPRALGAGRWGFEIATRDSACVPTGAGCRDVTLPDEALREVEVVVMPVTGRPAACAECRGGACGTPDAGALDAGAPPDAAPRDASPPGADAGACGPCDPPQATGTCVGVRCEIASCDPGFRDCDGSPADGCESECVEPPHTTPACYSGACVLGACERGWSDCDGRVTTGCEHAGPCTCPASGPCTFRCTTGCAVSCDRDCQVDCRNCAVCDLTCGPGATCTLSCFPGGSSVFGGPGSTTPITQTCELVESC